MQGQHLCMHYIRRSLKHYQEKLEKSILFNMNLVYHNCMESEKKVRIEGVVTPNNETITKYGHLQLFKDSSYVRQYFQPGDIITVEILGQTFDAPYVITFTDVDCYNVEIIDINHFGTYLAVNFADIVSLSKVAHKRVHKDQTYDWVSPYRSIPFSLTLKERGGYKEAMMARTVGLYSTKREDFPHLSDEEFVNFRVCDKGKMKKDKLYRVASPIDDLFGRAEIADKIIEKYHITHMVNLADDPKSSVTFKHYKDSYYSKISSLELCMGIDFHFREFKEKIKAAFEYIADNPEGRFAINCIEGKDRTGILIALFECLGGYTLEEIEEDYMISFYNYYGVKKGDARYDALKRNISIQLKYAFMVDELNDLEQQVSSYLHYDIGLDENTIRKVKQILEK